MRIQVKISSIFLLLIILPILLLAENTLPLHKERLSKKVLKIWLGDFVQTIAVIALATEKGIVVIDTNLSRSNDVRIRRAIEEEFGRNDFKYLINTHHHHDHTGGNQIYADATIIGQKNLRAGMEEELTGDGLAALLAKFNDMVKDFKDRLKNAKPGSDEYKYFEEFIILLNLALDDFKTGFIPTYPTILYEKNLRLDMGDMTLELFSFGGLHCDSTTVIFIPEEGIVEVGDHPPGPVLPMVRKDLKSDFSVTLDNWGRILSSPSEIKHVFEAHWDMPLSVGDFKEQYRYLNTLWNGISKMYHLGKTIDDAKKEYSIAEDFPYFKDKIIERQGQSIHEYNIDSIWEKIANMGRIL